MDYINSTLLEGLYQAVYSAPGTSSTREEGYHFSFIIIFLEVHVPFVKCHKTSDSRTCLGNDVASDNSNLCYFFSIFDSINLVLRKRRGKSPKMSGIVRLLQSDFFLELVKAHFVNNSSKTVFGTIGFSETDDFVY